MQWTRSAARGRGVVAALVLLCVACGSEGPPPDNGEAARPADRILRDSVAAVRTTARTVHMVGELPTGSDVLGLDLHVTRSGDMQGTVTLGGVAVGVVIAGGRAFLRGRELFARYGNAAAAQAIDDHWVMVGNSGAQNEIIIALGQFTDFGRLAEILGTPSGGAVTKGATSTVDGQPVVALRDATGTLYIATTGPPYPIEVKPDSGSQPLHFTSWDAPLDIRAPQGALDLSAVPGTATQGPSPSP